MRRCIHIVTLMATALGGVMAVTAYLMAQSDGGVSIVHKKEPLTAREVTSAIALLGLRYDRFEFETKAKTRLRFTMDEYLNGKRRKSHYSGFLSLEAGRFVLTILDDRRQEGSLEITYTLRNEVAGSVSSGRVAIIDTRDYFIAQKDYAPTLAEGEESLLCIWAGKRRMKGACLSIRFRGGQSLEDTVSENDLVLALFAEVESGSDN